MHTVLFCFALVRLCRQNFNSWFIWFIHWHSTRLIRWHYTPKCRWAETASWHYRTDSMFAPSQWETALLCNDVSHWLRASIESALALPEVDNRHKKTDTRTIFPQQEAYLHMYLVTRCVLVTPHGVRYLRQQRECIRIYRLQNGGHFVQASMH